MSRPTVQATPDAITDAGNDPATSTILGLRNAWVEFRRMHHKRVAGSLFVDAVVRFRFLEVPPV